MPRNERNDPAPRGSELEKLFGKLPPNEIAAEMACLGSMILGGVSNIGVIGEVQDVMRGPGDFSLPKHQAIYQAILDVYDETNALDTVKLSARLRQLNTYDAVGGIEYLVELTESAATSTFGAHYAKIVRDRAKLRDLIDECATTIRNCYECAHEGADDLLDSAEQRIFAITDKGGNDEVSIQPLSIQVQQTMDWLQTHAGEVAMTGIQSGYPDLDKMTGGFQHGEFIILAARPSMGKTAMALNIAENVAIDRNVPAGIFSLEMSRAELAIRVLSSRSRVDSQRIKRNTIGREELRLLQSAAREIGQSPLVLDDCAGLSVSHLRSRARRMKARYGIEILFVDYLQLMSAKGESRQVEVSTISRGIKAIARELKIPVVCLSQLNRNPEIRTSKKPMLSDLRESGAIEQDADVVMMLHREEYYHLDDKQWAQENPHMLNLGELIIGKQRNGPTGTVQFRWDPKHTRFNPASAAHTEDQQLSIEQLTGGY